MTYQLPCPQCKNLLLVTEGDSGTHLTCPRCLARLKVSGEFTSQTTPPSGQAELSAGKLLRASHCRRCGEQVQPNWENCPGCGTRVQPPFRLRSGKSADRDVQRDTGWTGIGLVLAGLLGAVGIFGMFFVFANGKLGPKSYEDDQAIARSAIGVAAVLGVVVIVGIVVSARRPKPGQKVWGIVMGVLALCVLGAAVAFSALVFLLSVCFAAMEKGHRH